MLKLKASDVKQFIYCPRIPFFTYVLPVEKKVTRKMEHGKEEHVQLDKLEKRRTFRRYNLQEGQRVFHARLHSERLGLEGMLDMHILARGECIPVEFKYTTGKPGLNHKYQLVAYAMLLEDTYHMPVRQGILYLTPGAEVYPVEVTPATRDFVKDVLFKLRRMVEKEQYPPPSRMAGRCTDCEYRNYCRDME